MRSAMRKPASAITQGFFVQVQAFVFSVSCSLPLVALRFGAQGKRKSDVFSFGGRWRRRREAQEGSGRKGDTSGEEFEQLTARNSMNETFSSLPLPPASYNTKVAFLAL